MILKQFEKEDIEKYKDKNVFIEHRGSYYILKNIIERECNNIQFLYFGVNEINIENLANQIKFYGPGFLSMSEVKIVILKREPIKAKDLL